MTVEEIMAALQAILDTAAAEERPLSDEEAERCLQLENDLKAVSRTAQFRSRLEHYGQAAPVGAVATATLDPVDKLERAFEAYLRSGQPQAELAQYRAQSEGTSTAGGYLVPTDMLNRITERMKAYGGFAEAAETITTSEGNPLEWPTIDDTANVGEIVAEGGTFAAGADLVFGIKTLGAYKYMAGGASALPLKVSWELVQDSAFDIAGFVSKALGTRIARVQAPHWLTGTGVAQPEGLLTPKTAYDEITSNSAGPTYAELVATVHALDPAYRAGAKWVMNDTTLGVIRSQLDGDNRPIWLPSATGDLSSGLPGGTLLGYPVVIDQAMPSIGDQTKFLAFGDMKEAYIIRRVKDVTLVTLNELYAANGQVGYMAWARADGAVNDANAYVVLAGQNT